MEICAILHNLWCFIYNIKKYKILWLVSIFFWQPQMLIYSSWQKRRIWIWTYLENKKRQIQIPIYLGWQKRAIMSTRVHIYSTTVHIYSTTEHIYSTTVRSYSFTVHTTTVPQYTATVPQIYLECPVGRLRPCSVTRCLGENNNQPGLKKHKAVKTKTITVAVA